MAPIAYGNSGNLKYWFQHHFNMVNASAKIVYNKQRIREDGTVLLYLRVIIDRQKKDIDLKLYWPKDRFDEKNGRCLPIKKGDENHKDYNVILADAEARATEIFVQYRLRRLGLSLSVFLKEYHSNLNRNDFIQYYENRMYQRLQEHEINDETVRTQLVTLHHLKNWKGTLLFHEINNRTALAFDTYLLTKTGCKSLNARWGQHKNFKTYLNQAKKKDQIQFVNPYDSFSAKSEMGRFLPLSKDQLIQLYEYYDEPLIHPTHRRVLRGFLFCCFTGMRHSDVRRFDLDWIDGEFFDFVPWKTRRFGTKVRIPITKEAMAMLADEIEESRPNKMFRTYTEQTENDVMKEIADLLEIRMELCFQIARETFATLYMEEDGKLEVLASFMGHKTTQQSEKYIKIMDARKKTERVRISNFVRADFGQTNQTDQTTPKN